MSMSAENKERVGAIAPTIETKPPSYRVQIAPRINGDTNQPVTSAAMVTARKEEAAS
jgi:hypothetical protein